MQLCCNFKHIAIDMFLVPNLYPGKRKLKEKKEINSTHTSIYTNVEDHTVQNVLPNLIKICSRPFTHLSAVEVNILSLAEGVVPRLTELTLVVKTVGIGDILNK